jgi:hypothetical protein
MAVNARARKGIEARARPARAPKVVVVELDAGIDDVCANAHAARLVAIGALANEAMIQPVQPPGRIGLNRDDGRQLPQVTILQCSGLFRPDHLVLLHGFDGRIAAHAGQLGVGELQHHSLQCSRVGPLQIATVPDQDGLRGRLNVPHVAPENHDVLPGNQIRGRGSDR